MPRQQTRNRRRQFLMVPHFLFAMNGNNTFAKVQSICRKTLKGIESSETLAVRLPFGTPKTTRCNW